MRHKVALLLTTFFTLSTLTPTLAATEIEQLISDPDPDGMEVYSVQIYSRFKPGTPVILSPDTHEYSESFQIYTTIADQGYNELTTFNLPIKNNFTFNLQSYYNHLIDSPEKDNSIKYMYEPATNTGTFTLTNKEAPNVQLIIKTSELSAGQPIILTSSIVKGTNTYPYCIKTLPPLTTINNELCFAEDIFQCLSIDIERPSPDEPDEETLNSIPYEPDTLVRSKIKVTCNQHDVYKTTVSFNNDIQDAENIINLQTFDVYLNTALNKNEEDKVTQIWPEIKPECRDEAAYSIKCLDDKLQVVTIPDINLPIVEALDAHFNLIDKVFCDLGITSKRPHNRKEFNALAETIKNSTFTDSTCKIAQEYYKDYYIKSHSRFLLDEALDFDISSYITNPSYDAQTIGQYYELLPAYAAKLYNDDPIVNAIYSAVRDFNPMADAPEHFLELVKEKSKSIPESVLNDATASGFYWTTYSDIQKLAEDAIRGHYTNDAETFEENLLSELHLGHDLIYLKSGYYIYEMNTDARNYYLISKEILDNIKRTDPSVITLTNEEFKQLFLQKARERFETDKESKLTGDLLPLDENFILNSRNAHYQPPDEVTRN